MWRAVLLAYAALALAAPTLAETYVVNPDGTGDFPTIQAAIDACVDGDVIELADGTFTGDGNRDVVLHGKAVTVRSQSGNAAACIIDCQGGSGPDEHGAFAFVYGEGNDSRLESVTMTGGTWNRGGAVYCWESGPTLTGCILRDNTSPANGGAMGCWNFSHPVVLDCCFEGNASGMYGGGGVWCHCSRITLRTCTLSGNSGWGGGALFLWYSTATLEGCTLVGNRCDVPDRGGGICLWDSDVMLHNSIIAFSTVGNAIGCLTGSHAALTCCDVYGNAGGDWTGCIADQLGVDGNICADPLFCDPENGDFALDCMSPCAPFTPPNAECDLIGAWPVGCGGTPAVKTTWGGVKALFKE